MADFRGTQQSTPYVWQARKPLRLPGEKLLQRGETFTPNQEMLTALRDLMVPLGETLQARAPEEPPVLPVERDTKGRFRREEAAG